MSAEKDFAKARSDQIVSSLNGKGSHDVQVTYDAWSSQYEEPMESAETGTHGTEESANRFFSQFDVMGYGGAKTSDIYTDWSNQYEHDLLNMSHGYTHPQKIARIAEAHLKDKEALILDVCAGTGLGGLALHQLGYTNIHAIDGSRGMLDIAVKKGVYKELFEELIGDDRINAVESGTYDAVVTSGSFLPGHLGPAQLRPLLAVLKPGGGIFCMALREEYLLTDYLRDLEPEMDRLEAAGVWRKVEVGVMEHYYDDLPGKYYVYQKL